MGDQHHGGRSVATGVGTAAHLTFGASLAVILGADGPPGWRVLWVAVVLAVAGAVLWRTGRRAAGWSALALGVVGAAVGLGVGVRHATTEGLSVDTTAGLLALTAGLVLLVAGWRRLTSGRRARVAVALAVVTFVVAVVVLSSAVPALLVTNVPEIHNSGRTPAEVGLEHRDVRIETDDGVSMAAWYVPSNNGAAVVLRHGAGSTRSDVLQHAAALAGGGYGVLLTDARGHGDSTGRAMDFGWYGDEDLAAAVSFLAERRDVDPARIGVVGLSMGGEEAIGAAGSDRRVRAVVAEGATARTLADKDWYADEYGTRGELQLLLERLQYGLTDVLTAAGPPAPLRTAVSDANARFLLVAAGEVPDEQHAAAHLRVAAPDRVDVWVVEEADHTAGLRVDPAGWERRVVDFLDAALGR